MSRARAYHSQGGPYLGGCRSSFNGNHSTITTNDNYNRYNNNGNYISNHNNFHDYSRKFKGYNNRNDYVKHGVAPLKRRKFSASTWADSGGDYQPKAYNNVPSICDNSLVLPDPSRSDANAYTSTSSKRDRSKFEAEDYVDFMSKEEIDSYSPSRKDGIDVLHETHLRYSYCAFLQNLGLRLDLPQTTVGTAMILCHRFFVRRSHACHDRFLIATATLFLVAKSEETARSLNDVLRASCEITHKQDLTALSYLLPSDWFEQYRERVIEAEQLILTTLDFELTVQHPYVPLTSILDKLGLSKSILVNLALNLISEGIFWCCCSAVTNLSEVVYRISMLAYMIFLAGGLICCSWKFCFTSEVEPPMCCGCIFMNISFNYQKLISVLSIEALGNKRSNLSRKLTKGLILSQLLLT